MSSLDSGLGGATSTPRIDRLSSSQEARRRLMSRSNNSSLSPPLSEMEMPESDPNIRVSYRFQIQNRCFRTMKDVNVSCSELLDTLGDLSVKKKKQTSLMVKM